MQFYPLTSPHLNLKEVGISQSLFEHLNLNNNSLLKLSSSLNSLGTFSPKVFSDTNLNNNSIFLHPIFLFGFSADFDGSFYLTLDLIS